ASATVSAGVGEKGGGGEAGEGELGIGISAGESGSGIGRRCNPARSRLGKCQRAGSGTGDGIDDFGIAARAAGTCRVKSDTGATAAIGNGRDGDFGGRRGA